MLKDFELITHTFQTDKITIIPISDVHISAANCKLNEFKSVVKYIVETPNVYCTLGGDIIDNGIISGKVASAAYDNVDSPMQSIKKAADILKPLAEKNKILGVVSGNHCMRSEKIVDINPMYLICSELGIQDLYRRNLAIIKVQLGDRNNNKGIGKLQTYTILLHHGKGTSKNALDKDYEFINQFEGADIIFTGHVHQGRVVKRTKKFINKQCNKATNRDVTEIVTNSFLDDCDYALQNMMVGNNSTIISIDLLSGKKKNTVVHY